MLPIFSLGKETMFGIVLIGGIPVTSYFPWTTNKTKLIPTIQNSFYEERLHNPTSGFQEKKVGWRTL
jgi:hypothetical protein